MRAACLLIVAIVMVAGCESDEELIPTIVHTPLALDPTEDVELSAWWANGRTMLHLGGDGHYELFEGLNRYRAPLQRGRWSRGSYAVIWLAPYDTREPERLRLSLARVDGTLRLSLPEGPPMIDIEGPPLVMEDRLFDNWSGPEGQLRLDRSMRYTFFPESTTVGHSGRWEVASHEELILYPQSPGLGPFRLRIEAGEDERDLRLKGEDAGFERVVPEARPLA